MASKKNSIAASVGAASIVLVGGSVTAMSIGTVIVATGGAAALGFIGYGIYRKLSGGK